MANFNLSKMAVNMFCPGNVVQLDDAGLPSVLVYIPAFKNSDVLVGGDPNTHPAFIVNGREIPGFHYSKYENVVYNGKAYSLPAEDPAAAINFDTARQCCEAKGYGWHMSTNAEWAAIALWCKANGILPYGNNNFGKDNRESHHKAIETLKDRGKTGRVATGTGPLTWSHDRTPSGIWDMNGNVWEWQGGIRYVWGELQILANNDAADPDNPQNETSTSWKAISAANGSLVEPESKVTDTAGKAAGATVKIDWLDNTWTYNTGVTNARSEDASTPFGNLTCTAAISEAAKVQLRALALLPDEGAGEGDYENASVLLNNTKAERVITRGGYWNYGELGGVFNYYGDSRTTPYASVGFRSAYIPTI